MLSALSTPCNASSLLLRSQAGPLNKALLPRASKKYRKVPPAATYALLAASFCWLPSWHGFRPCRLRSSLNRPGLPPPAPRAHPHVPHGSSWTLRGRDRSAPPRLERLPHHDPHKEPGGRDRLLPPGPRPGGPLKSQDDVHSWEPGHPLRAGDFPESAGADRDLRGRV